MTLIQNTTLNATNGTGKNRFFWLPVVVVEAAVGGASAIASFSLFFPVLLLLDSSFSVDDIGDVKQYRSSR